MQAVAATAAVADPRPPPPDPRVRGRIPERVDVAIVGCGLGGLMAAAHLARRGMRVACFDSHYVAGGCATHFSRRHASGRYRFDVGLHYIGDCGPDGKIPEMLREVGVEQQFVPLDPDGFDVLEFPDFRFRIPVSTDLYRERLLALFPGERRGIDRYLAFLHQMHTVAPRVDANNGKLTPRLLLDIALNGRLLALYQHRTLAAFLDTCTHDPKLRAVLVAQNGDYGLPPSEVAALLHIGLADHYFRGAFYPKGGGQMIADKLAAAVEAAGGTIHLRRGIARILIEGGRAVGVRTEPGHGGVFDVRAGVVISNADYKRTFLNLIDPEQVPAAYLKRVQQSRMGGAVFLTCLGIRGDLRPGLGANNVWQFDDYDTERGYRWTPGEAPMPRGSYITSASLKDPGTTTHAPPGITSVEVMALVPGQAEVWGVDPAGATSWRYKKDTAYHALKERIEEDLVTRLDRLLPGTRERIVYRESATPVTQTRFTRASDGTGYGLALTPDQFQGNRPGFRGPIRGLYLAGASTRANHGIFGALLSGKKAAEKVLEDVVVEGTRARTTAS
jgi:phytoene dehydrogenase-like protein